MTTGTRPLSSEPIPRPRAPARRHRTPARCRDRPASREGNLPLPFGKEVFIR